MNIKVIAAGLAASLAGMCLTSAAWALSYDFDIGTASFTITGKVVTSGGSSYAGGFDVQKIYGTVYENGIGTAISGLVTDTAGDAAYTGGTDNLWIYDNVLYPDATPVVDNPGILFSAGGFEYNVYTVGTTYYLSTNNNTAGDYNPGEPLVSGSVTDVPEPQTWAMMGIGFVGLGLAGIGRAKKSRAAVAAA